MKEVGRNVTPMRMSAASNASKNECDDDCQSGYPDGFNSRRILDAFTKTPKMG